MKADKREKITTAIKILFYLSCAFCLMLVIYYNANDKWSRLPSDEPVFIEEWTVIDSKGESFKTGRTYKDKRLYTEDFTIISRIPDSTCDDSYLCFANRGSIDVYIDGKLRYSYDNNRDNVFPQGAVKRFYITIPLKGSDAEKEVRLVKQSTRRRSDVVSETFVSGMGGVYSYLIRNYGLTFAMSEILFFLSMAVVLVGIGMRFWYRQRINMFYAAMGIFVTAAWLISDSYLYPFAYGHYHIDGLQSYLWCLMMPFGHLFYLDSIQKGRHWKILSKALILSAANLIIWPVLHFSGVFLFSQALEIMDSVLGIVIICVFATVVIDIKQGGANEYKYTAFGFVLFTLICLWEIVNVVIIKPHNDSVPMVVGLLVLLAFVVVQQVDDLRRIADEKRRAIELSDAKTNFLANMSHEIRTPINSILGMNEMILSENHDRKIDEYARNVQASGKMLLSLINDVLDFSQLEADKMKIIYEDVRLTTILLDILAMTAERAGDKGLNFSVKLDGEVPDGIYTDEVRLKQVLINLINNAVKYTDEGSVTLSVGGRYVADDLYELRLSVKDTGRGIRDEDKEGLFDAFSRADLVRNRNIEGTGLGLAIVRRILDSMGGTISVESEYLRGTVFDTLIPAKVTDRTPVDPDLKRPMNVVKADNAEINFKAPSANVLAVDDNRSNLDIVRMFLGRVDIRPTLCRGGREAVEMCYDHKYDLILLDHMMPEVDGLEALKMIRKDKGSLNKDTPVLVLTANAVSGSDKMYLDAGFAGYLTKPIDSRKLIKTVKKFLPEDKILKEDDMAGSVMEETDGTIKEPDKEETVMAEDMGFMERLAKIEGIDIDGALVNCGGDEGILEVVIEDILSDSSERISRMRELVKAGNYKDFGIEAHALKGIMATIGVIGLSERAKKHEFAAKEGNTTFINEDCEGLLKEFEDLCARLS